jgi:hypothetical protein
MMHPDFNEIFAEQHREILQSEAKMANLARQLDVGTGRLQDKRALVVRGAIGVGLAAFGLGLLFGSLVVESAGLMPAALIMAGLSLFAALPLLIQSFKQFPGGNYLS